VVVYLPAWMTVGGAPCAMIAGLPAGSNPVTTLFTRESRLSAVTAQHVRDQCATGRFGSARPCLVTSGR